MTQAIFHPVARRELEEAIAYYNTERQGLGREFRRWMAWEGRLQ
jgi:hypothetical protein